MKKFLLILVIIFGMQSVLAYDAEQQLQYITDQPTIYSYAKFLIALREEINNKENASQIMLQEAENFICLPNSSYIVLVGDKYYSVLNNSTIRVYKYYLKHADINTPEYKYIKNYYEKAKRNHFRNLLLDTNI